MEWELKSDRPIYTQLLEELKRRIVSGYYKPGEKLLPVRELAQEAKVNPNTMQKALTELERQALVFAVRTTGRYITEDEELVMKTKKEFAASHVKNYFEEMTALGLSKEEMIQYIKEYEDSGLSE
ncbi:MAG: GntR family transcriptional regulator [Lachnospiraceae bacterium]|nr:GntR family transcriptional regulator [Lachnospiraceae bacterium]